MRLAPVIIGMLLGTLLVAGCGGSDEEVRDEFARFVAKNGSCAADGECVLVNAGCPLPCWVAVRADRQAATEAKARSLIAEYEKGGRACAYGCVAGRAAACVAMKCTVVEVDAGADAGQ